MRTHAELKDHYRRDTPRERAAVREMMEDVLRVNPTSEFHLMMIKVLDELDAEGASVERELPMGDQANHRRSGGQKASNQFGTFEVKHATDRQAGFLRNLLETRDYSSKSPRVRAEIEKAARELGTGKVAKRLASDAIDALLTCPQIEGTAHTALASEAQVSFLRSLLTDRDASAVTVPTDDLDHLSRDQASTLIEQLKAAPRRTTRHPQAVEVEAGIYLVDGDVVKVQKAVHGSGHMYAKVLNPETAKFEFVSGAIRRVRPEHKMTLDQAKEYGALYGICCNCGRTLTDETSIERAIGPKCAKRFG